MPTKPKAATSTRITKSKTKQGKDSVSSQRKPLRSYSKIMSAVEASANSKKTAIPTERKKNGPVYFWRPHEGFGWLGQWYPSEFTVDSETYATAEMWMMVQKARLFEDEKIATAMLATTDPKTHKALGRKVQNFKEATWDEHKLDIVIQGNIHKFTISEDAENLRGLLLATGDRELVEASALDRIWGVGFAEKNAGQNRHRWGKNLLGKALMSVRQRLREEAGEEKKKEGEETSA